MTLEHLANSIFAQLELASGASAKALGEYTTHGKAAGAQPRRVATPHLHYRHRFENCNTSKERHDVLVDAIEELRSIRYAKRSKVDRNTKEGRIEIGRDPRPVGVVASIYGFSVRHVHRCRAEARRVQAIRPTASSTLTSVSVLDLRSEEATWNSSPPAATASRRAASAKPVQTEPKASKQGSSSTTAQASSDTATTRTSKDPTP